MVRTRLQAALDGWKLYRIGADLERRIGDTLDDELEVTIRRQVTTALRLEFLPSGTFTVKTITIGNLIDVYVYVQEEMIGKVQVSRNNGQIKVH